MTPTTKAELRALIRAQREALSSDARSAANKQLITHVTAYLDAAHYTTIAAYFPLATEPGGPTLVEELHKAGYRVLLPACAPSRQLSWGFYTGAKSVAAGYMGIMEPITSPLNSSEALTQADAVLVPAMAATPTGFRLGKGAGFYDRALATNTTHTITLIYHTELVDDVFHEAHDVPTDTIITDEGIQGTASGFAASN